MTLKQIMDLKPSEISKLSRSELGRVVNTIGAVVNKRYGRLKESPAAKGLERSGGKIRTRGKTVDELRGELLRAKTFISAKTSTIKGFRAYEKNRENEFSAWLESNNIGDYERWSESEKSRFWKLLDSSDSAKVIEAYFGNYKGSESISVAMDIFSKNPNISGSDFASAFLKAAEENYETEQAERNATEEYYLNKNYYGI